MGASEIAALVAGMLVAAVVEEVAFRGYLQDALLERLRPNVAIPLVATVFAAAHLTYNGLGALLFALSP